MLKLTIFTNTMNKKIFLFLLLNIIILSGLAVGYLWYIGNNGQPSDIGQTTTQDNVKEITSDIDTSDWQTYRNEEYGFEFMYPEGWEVDLSYSNGTLNEIIIGDYLEDDVYVIEVSLPSFEACIDSLFSLGGDYYMDLQSKVKNERKGELYGRRYYYYELDQNISIGGSTQYKFPGYSSYCIQFSDSETINIQAPLHTRNSGYLDAVMSTFKID
ncbi:MAG: hypothetical protein ACPGO5_01990 [Patescibacteria group bacterium]